jgi:SAM-dependent methyltransferase
VTATMPDPRLAHRSLRQDATVILAGLAVDSDLVAPELRVWWSEYLESHTPHFLNLLEMLERIGDVRRVLDVGNFPGHFTILLRHLGLEAEGVDLNPGRGGQLWEKHNVLMHKVDIEMENLPIPDNSFDAVILGEVFEHLRINPFRPLREIYRVVRPGGHLLFSVPNVSPRHRLRFFFGRDYQGDIIAEFQSLDTIGHMGHFRLYSRTEVIRILRYAGFDVCEFRVAGYLPGGRWRFVRFFGPFRNCFRSHAYVLARKPG